MARDAVINEVILDLFDKKAVKFGEYTLKSGITSPIYIDLRVIISYPQLLEKISLLIWDTVQSKDISYDYVCGVPYTALPIATCISLKLNKPMLMRRKEAKNYGTKKIIEGDFSEGCKCLVIEDLVTSGLSTLETVNALRDVGVVVNEAAVLLDREQGAVESLSKHGVSLHSAFTMTQLLAILETANKIDSETSKRVREFISQNSSVSIPLTSVVEKELTYAERINMCHNEAGKKLLKLMDDKKTNLAVAVDVTSCSKLLELATEIGPHICVLKTHVDICDDFSVDSAKKLVELSEKFNFLIMEDRKFCDIGNTVQLQYSKGPHQIADWSHFVTAHSLPGPGVISALKNVGLPKNRGCFLVAEMSSEGNLVSEDYTSSTVDMALNNLDFVCGFVSQSRISTDRGLIQMTPGVNMSSTGDNLGQNYVSPHDAIVKRHSDIIIVGRGITNSTDPAKTALDYKLEAWKAYLETTQK